MQEEGNVTSPSSLVQNLDPAVERVILRCLSKHPAERPSSALAVAAAMPGGDPVAAALAAGETPSPEMVAAAGEEQGLRPTVAVGLFAAFLVGLVVVIVLSARTHLTNHVPLPKRPEVLVHDAREILRSLGHTAEPLDSAHGFAVDEAYLDHVEEEDDSAARWDRLATDRPGEWGREVPAGQGEVDWDAFFDVALMIDPAVNFIIECESSTGGTADIAEAQALIESRLATGRCPS